jgi:hypothetical protein
LTDRRTCPWELTMNVKKIVGWAVVIFLAWYLFTKPTGAATAVHSLFNLLKQAGTSVATFLNSL